MSQWSKRSLHFWVKFEYELETKLGEARDKYREQIKLCHPDKGGDIKRAAQLNVVWKRIRELFRRRGVTLP